MKGLIHGHLTDAVLVGQFDTAVNRLVSNCPTELLAFAVPYLGGGKTTGYTLDGGGGGASSSFLSQRDRPGAGLLMYCEYGYHGGWHGQKSGRHISVRPYQSHGRHRPVRPIGYGYLPGQYKKYLRSLLGKGCGMGTLFAWARGCSPFIARMRLRTAFSACRATDS